jgi:hypothetical protein
MNIYESVTSVGNHAEAGELGQVYKWPKTLFTRSSTLIFWTLPISLRAQSGDNRIRHNAVCLYAPFDSFKRHYSRTESKCILLIEERLHANSR